MIHPKSDGRALGLAYSLADQSFSRSKSLGILNVSIKLCRALIRHSRVHEVGIITNGELADKFEAIEGVRMVLEDSPLGGRWKRIVYDQWRLYSIARQEAFPWLLLPKGYASFLRPCPVKLACFVHDVIEDHYRAYHRDYTPPLESLYFQRSLAAAIRRSDAILTNSSFTRSEVLRFARERGWPTPNVTAVGIGMSRSPKNSRASATGLLVLTSRFPHKRTDLAVEYLDRWPERGFSEDVQLGGKHAVRVGGTSALELDLAPSARGGRLPLAPATVMPCPRLLLRIRGLRHAPGRSHDRGCESCLFRYPRLAGGDALPGPPFANESYDSFARGLEAALTEEERRLDQWAETLLATHDWGTVAERVVRALEALRVIERGRPQSSTPPRGRGGSRNVASQPRAVSGATRLAMGLRAMSAVATV